MTLSRRISFRILLISILVFVFTLGLPQVIAAADGQTVFSSESGFQDKPGKPEISNAFPFSGAQGSFMRVASLSDKTFLLAYQKENYDLAIRVGAVRPEDGGGEKIVYGAESVVEAREQDRNYNFFKLVALNNGEAALFYNFNGSGNEIRVRFIKINPETLEITTPPVPHYEVPQLNYNQPASLSVAKLTGNSVAVAVVENSPRTGNKEGYASVVEFKNGEAKIRERGRFVPYGKIGATHVVEPVIIPLTERKIVIGWSSSGGRNEQDEYDSEMKGYVMYGEYDGNKFHFDDKSRAAVFTTGDFHRLQGVALSGEKFLLSFEEYKGAGSKQETVLTGEIFENHIALSTATNFPLAGETSLNLTAPARDVFTLDYGKPGSESERFIRIGQLQNENVVLGDEVAFNSSWKDKYWYRLGYQLTRLSDYKFLIAYNGNESGTLIATLAKQPPPAVYDSSPSLLKTIGLTGSKFLSVYANEKENDSGWARVGEVRSGDGGETANTIFGEPQAFSREDTLALNAAALDAQNVLLFYRSSGKTRAVVGTVSGNQISYGAPTEIRDRELLSDLNVIALGSRKAVLSYRTRTGYAVLRPVSISGGEITPGAEYIVDTPDQDARFENLTIAGSGNRLLIAYGYRYKVNKRDSGTQYRFRSARVSEDKIDFGAPVAVRAFQNPDAEFMTDSKFAVAYRSNVDENAGKILAGLIDEQGNINLGEPLSFSAEPTHPVALAKIDKDTLSLIYGNYRESYTDPVDKIFVRLVSFDGMNPQAGAPETLPLGGDQSSLLSICGLTPTDLVLTYSLVKKQSAEVRIARANLNDKIITLR